MNFSLSLSLIPNDDLEDSNSSKSEGSDQEDGIVDGKLQRQVEDDELGDGLKVTLSSDGSLDTNDSFNSHRHHPLNHQDAIGGFIGFNGLAPSPAVASVGPTTMASTTELLMPSAAATRRRRKLPEIPKNKKCEWDIILSRYEKRDLATRMPS